jgi:hypothetical protein
MNDDLIPISDAQRKLMLQEICKCNVCKGTIERRQMCVSHQFIDYFLSIGKAPPIALSHVKCAVAPPGSIVEKPAAWPKI